MVYQRICYASVLQHRPVTNTPGSYFDLTVAEEIFDVVDQNDVVIDKCERSRVHALGLRHRSVHLLVFDSNGRLFLQKRSMTKDENPGQWDSSVAGHVDSGESYDLCVVREAAEELGLTLSETPQRLFKFDATPKTGMEFCWIYRCTADGPFELNEEEIDDGAWFEPPQLDRELALDEQSSDRKFTEAIFEIWTRLRQS